MTDAEMIAAFDAMREDLDSVPFAHEDTWTEWTADRLESAR